MPSFFWHSSMRFCLFSALFCLRPDGCPENHQAVHTTHWREVGRRPDVKCRGHCKEALACMPLRWSFCALCKHQMTEGYGKEAGECLSSYQKCQLFGTFGFARSAPIFVVQKATSKAKVIRGYMFHNTTHRNVIKCPNKYSFGFCAFGLWTTKCSRPLGQRQKGHAALLGP